MTTPIYLLLVTGPGLALLAYLGSVPLVEWPGLILPTGRRFALWWHSVGLAAAVAIAGMALGVLVALRLQQQRSGIPAKLRWGFLMLIPLPPVTHAMAWSWLFGRVDLVLRQAGLSRVSFEGWAAAWWVQTLWLVPIATGLAMVALGSVNPLLIEAGRLHHPDDRVLTRVVLPLALPLILAGGGLLFLLSLVDYTIPSLFQVNVYALDIFADFAAHNQPGRSLLLSLPLLAITAGTILVSQGNLRSAALDPGGHRHAALPPRQYSPWVVGLQRAALAVIGLAAGVPLVSLLVQLGSWARLYEALASAHAEIGYSIGVALLAALLSLPLAYGVARGALRTHATRWLWWLGITAPLAMPGPLVGIGLIAIWARPLPLSIYGSWAMPVLAAVARYTPLAALVLIATLRRLNPTLIDAARLLQTSAVRTWLLIRAPLLAPGLLAAAGLVFCLTLGELSATLLVAAPGRATLTMRIYNFLHYGASDTVAGLTLVLTGLVLALSAVTLGCLTAWSRLTAGGRG